jgi:universal stress protein A
MIRNILVPTDFSLGSQAALAYARELAGALGASLHLLHVVENPFFAGSVGEVYAPPPRPAEETLRLSQERLERCLSADDKVKLHAVMTTRTGIPFEEILDRLEEDPPIHMVVMATHGRGGIARLVLGSVTDKVVRGAPCPVVTVKGYHVAQASTAAVDRRQPVSV